MADTEVISTNPNTFGEGVGPKKYGIKAHPEADALEAINQIYLDDEDYSDVENLEDKLQTYKAKFLEFESNGAIDLMGLKRMMEKIGQAKTHLELKKMIAEVDTINSGTICYRDFIEMMVGRKNSVLKLILLFEEKANGQGKKSGVAPKRDLSSLP